LKSYLRRVDAADFEALAAMIERDNEALERLKDYLTINVSEFFRNPERFEDLEKRVLPELLQRFGRLTVWSAGASIGAEAYSLSILLLELDPHTPHQILATDIDEKALDEARLGV